MVVDSSAILAIYFGEPEKDHFLDLILSASSPCISTANYVEIFMKMDPALNDVGRQAFEEFMDSLGLEIRPLSVDQAKIARRANQLFGRGSGHKAKLNFGDCFAYALAKDTQQPLLFKGNDFIHVDIRQVSNAQSS